MIKVILFDIDGVLIRLLYYHSKVLQDNGFQNAKKFGLMASLIKNEKI